MKLYTKARNYIERVYNDHNSTAEAFITLVDRLQKVIDDLAKGVRE